MHKVNAQYLINRVAFWKQRQKQVQGYLRLYSEFEAILQFKRVSFKRNWVFIKVVILTISNFVLKWVN